MRRIISLAFLALVSFATLVNAQTSSATSNPLTLVITPFLVCSPTRGIDFGSHTRRDGTLFTSATSYASWDCDTDPGNSVRVTFTLPSAMTNPQATALPVPLTYGTQSAFIDQNASSFDPSSGLANDVIPVGGDGTFVIQLGKPINNLGATELVKADISTASTQGGGHYSGTVLLTVQLN